MRFISHVHEVSEKLSQWPGTLRGGQPKNCCWTRQRQEQFSTAQTAAEARSQSYSMGTDAPSQGYSKRGSVDDNLHLMGRHTKFARL